MTSLDECGIGDYLSYWNAKCVGRSTRGLVACVGVLSRTDRDVMVLGRNNQHAYSIRNKIQSRYLHVTGVPLASRRVYVVSASSDQVEEAVIGQRDLCLYLDYYAAETLTPELRTRLSEYARAYSWIVLR